MLRRTLGPLGLLLTLLLGASALVPGPAVAGTVTSGDVDFTASGGSAQRGQCTYGFYRIGLGPESNYADWSADVTVTKPSGAVLPPVSLSPSEFQLSFGPWCAGRDQAGTYKVVAQFTGFDPGYNVIAEKTLSTTMTFTVDADVETKLVAKRAKLGKHKWLVVGHLLRDGTSWDGQKVVLQVRKKGTWRAVTSSRTDIRGLVGFKAKPTKSFAKLTFRLRYTGSGYLPTATSKTFKLPKR